MFWNSFLEFDTFFWYSNWKYFQYNFAKFQGAIWKFFSQGFQNRSYFLEYVVLRIAKLNPNLSTYGYDTLYILLNWVDWKMKNCSKHLVKSQGFQKFRCGSKKIGPIVLCWSKGRPEKKWKGVRSQMRRELQKIILSCFVLF